MAKPKFPGRRTGNPAAGAKPQASGGAATVTVEPTTPKVRTSPMQFLGQVRAEGRKIVWPSRKETWITSVMVFIMVLLAAGFFWIVDLLLGMGFERIISFGS
jgi:preprotein translocase subunit SecE